MGRFLFSTIGFVSLLGVGWYYLPEETREKAGAFVAGAFSRNREVVVDAIREKIIPETPIAKREKLITELGTSIQKTKEALKAGPLEKKDPEVEKRDEIIQILQDSESIVEELHKINTEEGSKEKIMERILDAVLPARQKEEVCRAEN